MNAKQRLIDSLKVRSESGENITPELKVLWKTICAPQSEQRATDTNARIRPIRSVAGTWICRDGDAYSLLSQHPR